MISKKIKRLILLITICLSAYHSIAQTPVKGNSESVYRAVNWGLAEGLSQAEAYHMLKDVNGFLWIATSYGLNRFDGNSFKIFYEGKSKNNITGNGIKGLIEDSLHNIWIGTDKGLSRYDIKADTFSNFSSALVGDVAVPFWATRNEVFYWDYPGQLTAINIKSFAKKTLLKLMPTDTAGYSTSDAYTVFDSASNSLWIEKGIPGWVGGTGGGLLQISLATGKREDFRWPCYKKIPNHSHFSEGMRYDRKRNSIWISSPDGLIEFTLDDKKFHNIDAWNKFADLGNQWAGIDIDPQGIIWMGTYPKGIIIYDPANHSVTLPFPNDSVLQKKVSDANVSIYCDRDGIVWSGAWGRRGIYEMVPFSKVVTYYTADPGNPYSLSDNTVYHMVNADGGRIWIGTDHGGLNIFDPNTDKFEVLKGKDLPGIKINPHNTIIPISVDTILKKAWLIADGFFEMDLNTKKCRPIVYEDSNGRRISFRENPHVYPQPFRNGCIVTLIYDGKAGIFIVTHDNAVAREVISLPDNSIKILSAKLIDDRLIFIKHDPEGINLTYTNINDKWIHTPNALDSVQWSSIYYNNTDKSYWVTVERELFHYNKDFHILRRYTVKDGLPDLQIYGPVQDNIGNIWFHTDRSIHQLNTQTNQISTLSEKDGFEKQDFSSYPGNLKDGSGNIYFMGQENGKGFNRISPDRFKSYSPSLVYLQSLEINQKPFPLPTGVNNLQDLSLRYFENKITIETGVIDYYSKGKSHIRYKLETDDKKEDWQYAPDYYTIRYEGLSPGSYKLVIQASNAGNEFNGPEKTLLINISPAFWNTWWFRIIAGLLVIAVIYGFMRKRLQEKFRLKLERSKKETQLAEMGKKTAELQQQAIELEMQALRAQMNPHFIFNSLNSINRFILQNNRTEASEYLTKFSKLVRMILQNSQAPLITLESELESLGLYLEMEALRFNYHFAYKVSVPKDMDIEVLKVPPLIIQPYVENAIWHGLMHKEEKGQLDIEVSQEKNELYLKVTDNGIGRKKASELSSKSATKHKSMGLRITAHRIAMMQKSGLEESPVIINDLVNPDGTAAGTEVTIKLPAIYD